MAQLIMANFYFLIYVFPPTIFSLFVGAMAKFDNNNATRASKF